MTPTVVCWQWQPPKGYRSVFTAESVRILRNMVRRYYPSPHRFVCVTDTPKDIDRDIETIQLWPDHALVPSPHGAHNPSCYRRLKVFAPDAGEMFGERVISMDLDTVITGDLAPLFDRPEDFVIWGQTDFPKTTWYNGSLWSLKTGTRTQVWTQFDPKRSPALAKGAGARGSDQGWIGYILGKKEATFGQADGVYSYRVHVRPNANRLPENARVVNFHGRMDPWSYECQKVEWIREAYR